MIPVLRRAMEANPRDARAPYYLGNLLFDAQPESAVKLWEQAAALDPAFPIVHRNLALAYSHQKPSGDIPRAIAQLEQAVAGPVKYALHFAELDELYAQGGAPPENRLALLEQNQAVVCKCDDALSREIGLQVFAGKYDEAIRLMAGRKFSVWEGGRLEVADHWVNAHLLRGRRSLVAGQPAAALADFQAAQAIPDNLPNDQEGSGRNAELAYWTGLACAKAGDAAKAQASWQEAAKAVPPAGGRRRSGGRFSERQVQTYYQALAKGKLGQKAEAENELRNLLEAANQAVDQKDSSEGPRDRQSRNTRIALARYAAGLAHLGLGEKEKARQEFTQALQAAPDSLGPRADLAGGGQCWARSAASLWPGAATRISATPGWPH
jgi:tetratricopeptide (TPR) repeat protein